MEELPQGGKYLGIIVSHLAPKKADQHLPQRLPREANCNFSAYRFYSANGQAYSKAYLQAEARPTSQ